MVLIEVGMRVRTDGAWPYPDGIEGVVDRPIKGLLDGWIVRPDDGMLHELLYVRTHEMGVIETEVASE